MLSAIEIVIKRTGLSEDDSDYYVTFAAARVRDRLGLSADVNVDEYMFKIADIATLLYQEDMSIRNAKHTLGYESYSVSEGGISKSQTGMTGSDVHAKYESEISDILNSIGGGVKFL